MKKNLFLIGLVAIIATACNYNTPSTYVSEQDVQTILTENNGRLYTIQELKDSFMSEEGNFTLGDFYRTRAHGTLGDWWLFNIDTLPEFGADGKRIYLQGRLVTDDYGGNFYKTLILQQVVNGEQQCIRIGVDAGSASGLYQKGQEVLICLSGLSLGRYGNQEQLCVPSYNNNTMAQYAEQKIGWMPGRIPAPLWRKAVTLIGLPDQSKIAVEELTPAQAYSNYISKYEDVKGCRQYDGRVVRIKGVHFNGKYTNTNGDQVACNIYQQSAGGTTGDPESDEYSNVFAPTTKNVGYPQSRVFVDANGLNPILSSCSEYAKFAHYYIPSDTTMTKVWSKHDTISVAYNVRIDDELYDLYTIADSTLYDIAFNYDAVTGNVEGILSYFMDNAGYAPSWTKWSISVESLGAFDLYNNARHMPWNPLEFARSNFYRNRQYTIAVPIIQ